MTRPRSLTDSAVAPIGTAPVPGVLAAVLAVLPVVALLACGDADAVSGGAEVVDSAGVAIVTSPAEDRALGVGLEADYRLGGKDTPEESFYEVGSYSVDVSPEGHVAVLDADNHRVVVFDADGEHLRTVGREGEGPGEIEWPVGIFWTTDGAVMVQDIAKRSLVGYDPAGQPIEGPRMPDGFFGGRIRALEDGLIFSLRSTDPGEQRLVARSAGGDTTTLVRIPQETGGAITLESCGMSFSGITRIFEPTLRWAAAGSEVAVATGAGYVVDVHRDGQVVRSIRRDVPVRPANRELAVAEVGDAMRVMTPAGERVCESGEVADQRGWAEVVPAVQQLALAPDGTLWVGRWGVGDEPGVIDLFDADGVYQGSLPAGTPFPVGFLPDGRVLWIETDEMDVDRLVAGRPAAPAGEEE